MADKIKIDSIDLGKIAQSGQCFRWRALPGGRFLVPAGSRFAVLSQVSPHEVRVIYSSDNDIAFWEAYLDAETDYEGFRALIDPDDEFLKKAGEAGYGIRILKQEPFEALLSFIISQRKNIPAIMSCVEKLCRTFGKMIGEYEGEEVYSFPRPSEISEKGILECSLGYRAPYLLRAAEAFREDGELTEKLSSLDDEKLLASLLEFYGVGIKVASCTALFGFHRLNVFPVDVWIKRALLEHYRDGFDLERYYPVNGLMQQYIFEYFRSMKR